jgi:hypothetical protein
MTQVAHIYHSGMELADVDPSWRNRTKNLFCTRCHRLRFPFRPLDIELVAPIPKRTDMFMANHSLFPLVISERMMDALTDLHAYLHVGRVFLVEEGVRRPLPFFTCTSRSDPVALHGRKPSVVGGKPVAESDRLSICEDCGIASRRERAPWFLPTSACPTEPTFCTDLGLAVPISHGEALRALGLQKVRIERVDVV